MRTLRPHLQKEKAHNSTHNREDYKGVQTSMYGIGAGTCTRFAVDTGSWELQKLCSAGLLPSTAAEP